MRCDAPLQTEMIAAGYNIRSIIKPEWVEAQNIAEVFSAGGVASLEFAEYSTFWKQNGFFLYDSADLVNNLANSIAFDLSGYALFYYEFYPQALVNPPNEWQKVTPDKHFTTNVMTPKSHQVSGFDVVEFTCDTKPECSPLTSCNLANKFKTNRYALFDTLDYAKKSLQTGAFHDSEPGPYRIMSVSLIKRF